MVGVAVGREIAAEGGRQETVRGGNGVGGGISKHIYSLQLINVLIMYLCFYICRRF